jgi:hypothetical protein
MKKCVVIIFGWIFINLLALWMHVQMDYKIMLLLILASLLGESIGYFHYKNIGGKYKIGEIVEWNDGINWSNWAKATVKGIAKVNGNYSYYIFVEGQEPFMASQYDLRKVKNASK